MKNRSVVLLLILVGILSLSSACASQNGQSVSPFSRAPIITVNLWGEDEPITNLNSEEITPVLASLLSEARPLYTLAPVVSITSQLEKTPFIQIDLRREMTATTAENAEIIFSEIVVLPGSGPLEAARIAVSQGTGSFWNFYILRPPNLTLANLFARLRIEEMEDAFDLANEDAKGWDAVRRSLIDLENRIGAFEPRDVELFSVEKKIWSDTSLGVLKPGMFYAQVLTEGHAVIFEVRGARYEYHTAENAVVLAYPEL